MRFARVILSFAAGSALLAASGRTVLSTEPGSVARRFGTDAEPLDSLRAVAASPDGRIVALAGEPENPTGNAEVQIRELATGRLLHRLGGHETPVRSIAVSHRGDLIATVTGDPDGVGITELFEAATGKRRLTIEAGGSLARFLPDGRLAIAGAARLTIFDISTGREVGRFPTMPVVKDVTVDGSLAVGVSHHGRGSLEVRDLGTGRTVARLEGCAAEPLAATFSPDGRSVAAADAKSRTILIWEVLTGQIVHRLGAGTACPTLLFSADGRHLIAGGFDKALRVWEVATGSEAGVLLGHQGAVTALALAPDGSLLSGSTDRTAVLWSAAIPLGTSLPLGPLVGADFDDAWEALAAADAAAAYRALGVVSHRRAEAVPEILRRVERQVRPVPNADLARLLGQLDHPSFLVREQATAELVGAGDAVRPHLERAFDGTVSPEVRSRLRLLLRRSGLTPRFSHGDLLRVRRLIGEAASLGGEDAKRLLRLLTDDFPDSAVAGEARAALRRMEP